MVDTLSGINEGRTSEGDTVVLRFRNIDVTPSDPVETWGVEGVLTAIERGGLRHARLIAAAIVHDPWGEFAQDVAEAISLTEAPMARLIGEALARARETDEEAVAREVRTFIWRSGLSQRAFAKKIGTTQALVSRYATGDVTPSAAVMRRMARAVA